MERHGSASPHQRRHKLERLTDAGRGAIFPELQSFNFYSSRANLSGSYRTGQTNPIFLTLPLRLRGGFFVYTFARYADPRITPR